MRGNGTTDLGEDGRIRGGRLDIVQLLASVDDRDSSECGVLTWSGEAGGATGSILVESRRICWVDVPGRGARLRELLQSYASPGHGGDALGRLIERGLSGDVPLLDLLLVDGFLSEDDLRLVIWRHVVESLVAQLGDSLAELTWTAHRDPAGYRARFLFFPVELLAAVGAEICLGEHQAVASELDDVSSLARCWGAFAIGGAEHPVLVDFAGEAILVRDAVRIGIRAVAALTAFTGFSPGVMGQVVARASGPMLLAWRPARRVVRFALIDQGSALSEAASVVARRGYSAILSSYART